MDGKPMNLIIFAYSRADALADGNLIDVTDMAREAGILYSVALTAAVWETCVRVPEGVTCQDEQGRLWDALWMFRCAASRAQLSVINFALHVRNDNQEGTPPLVRLKALCHPGDDAEPVVTIMMPEED